MILSSQRQLIEIESSAFSDSSFPNKFLIQQKRTTHTINAGMRTLNRMKYCCVFELCMRVQFFFLVGFMCDTVQLQKY